MLLLGSPIIPLLVHQHQQLHPLDNQQALDTLCLCTPPEQMVLYAYTDMPPCCDLTLELKHTHEKSYYVFQYKPIVQINTKTISTCELLPLATRGHVPIINSFILLIINRCWTHYVSVLLLNKRSYMLVQICHPAAI